MTDGDIIVSNGVLALNSALCLRDISAPLARGVVLKGGSLFNGSGDTVLDANLGIYVAKEGGQFLAGYEDKIFRICGPITGPGDVCVGYEHSVVSFSNPNNAWEGRTIIGTDMVGAGLQPSMLRLGADEVIPHGSGKGYLQINAPVTSICGLDLYGFTETVNALTGAVGTVIYDTAANKGGNLRLLGDSSFVGSFVSNVTITTLGGTLDTPSKSWTAGSTLELAGGNAVLTDTCAATVVGTVRATANGTLTSAQALRLAGSVLSDKASTLTVTAPSLVIGGEVDQPIVFDATLTTTAPIVFTNAVLFRSAAPQGATYAAGFVEVTDQPLNTDRTLAAGETLYFSAADTGTGSLTVPTGACVIFNTTQLDANGNITELSTGLTLANNLILAGGTVIFTGASTITYAGAVSGTGTFVKRGTGTLVLQQPEYAGVTALTLTLEEGAFKQGDAPAVTGPATIDLARKGLHITAGTATVDAPSGCRASLLKFNIAETKSTGVAQLSEIYLYLNGKRLAWPAGMTTAAPKAVYKNDSEYYPKVTDGDITTKWYLTSGYAEVELYLDLGEEICFDAMSYVTGNDTPGRDPATWTLARGTVVGGVTNWETVVDVKDADAQIPEARRTETPLFACCVHEDAFPSDHPISVATGATLVLGTMRDTFESLVCEGTLVLTNAAAITLGAGAHALTYLIAPEGTALYCAKDAVFTGTSIFTPEPALTEYFAHFCLRPYATGSSCRPQIAELELWYNGEKVVWPAGTVCHVNGVSDGGQGPGKLIDGDLTTKLYGTYFSWDTPLQFDLGSPVRADSYRWAYGNDNVAWPGRNLTSWRAFVSADGVTWREVDAQKNVTPPDGNYNYTFRPFCWFYGITNALPLATPAYYADEAVTFDADAAIELHAADQTFKGLNGGKSVYLARGVARLDVPEDACVTSAAAFTGAGDIVKSGAGVQQLTGTLGARGQLIVTAGVLDITGATLTGITNIVLQGGVLTGAATVAGDLTITGAGGAYGAQLTGIGHLYVTGALVLDAAALSWPGTVQLFGFTACDAESVAAIQAFTIVPAPAAYKWRTRLDVTATTCTLKTARKHFVITFR